jgi:hypothetical protein
MDFQGLGLLGTSGVGMEGRRWAVWFSCLWAFCFGVLSAQVELRVLALYDTRCSDYFAVIDCCKCVSVAFWLRRSTR